MPHSHHSHSGQFCSHADPNSSLRKVVERANQLGFTHFGLSEHVPRNHENHLYPEEIQNGLDVRRLLEIFRSYLKEARRLQKEYGEKENGHGNRKGIKILVGVETENIRTKKESQDNTDSENLNFLITALNEKNLIDESSDLNEKNQMDIKTKRKESIQFPEEIGKGLIDYLVGSVHHVYEIPIDFDKEFLEISLSEFKFETSDSRPETQVEPSNQKNEENQNRRRKFHKMISIYLDSQYEILNKLRPEIIGHLDLPFLFEPIHLWNDSHLNPNLTPTSSSPSSTERPDCSSTSAEEEISWKKLERNIRFASSYGALFEINSSAFRKGWETSYPSANPLKLILSLSGRLCLSDDSHGINQVGLNYLKSRNYLLKNQVESIWFLEKFDSIVHSIDDPNDGDDHDGWEKKKSKREKLEKERIEREKTSKPGEGAPVIFERGTIAKEMKNWENDEFWIKLETEFS